MGLPQAKPSFSIDDYLRRERDSAVKNEFHDGEILAMAGGTPEHSLISSNAIRELGNALKGKPCRAYDSNLRIRIQRSRRYVYPDATVVCGPLQTDPDDTKAQSILNPRVIVEVMSPSTEAYDRGEKFDYYRQIDSLEEYVLIHQQSPRVEVFHRQAGGAWAFAVAVGLDASARLEALGLDIPLREIYANIEFPPPAPPPEERPREQSRDLP